MSHPLETLLEYLEKQYKTANTRCQKLKRLRPGSFDTAQAQLRCATWVTWIDAVKEAIHELGIKEPS